METIVILFMALLVLDVAAWRWGFERRDTRNSVEWDQRRS